MKKVLACVAALVLGLAVANDASAQLRPRVRAAVDAALGTGYYYPGYYSSWSYPSWYGSSYYYPSATVGIGSDVNASLYAPSYYSSGYYYPSYYSSGYYYPSYYNSGYYPSYYNSGYYYPGSYYGGWYPGSGVIDTFAPRVGGAIRRWW